MTTLQPATPVEPLLALARQWQYDAAMMDNREVAVGLRRAATDIEAHVQAMALGAPGGAGTATPADPGALIRRLSDSLQDLIEHSDDPGTEALAAVWEGRQYAQTGAIYTDERPRNVLVEAAVAAYAAAHQVPLSHVTEGDDHGVEAVREALAAASRAPGEPRPTVDEMEAHFLDANERMGEALVAIGMALGLPRPRTGATWGAPEILAKIAAGAPGEPSPGLAVESSPLYQEALRIIREAWSALPAAVRDEAAKDGATLAGCIRAIPLAAPPLRGDAPVPAGEFDWFHTGQAPTSGGDR